jgi:D-amino-acid oxidase
MSEVRVAGCGIVGLTSAIRLQEEGHRVRIVARELPPFTTSNKAAAVWEPYKAEPLERVAEWAARSYVRYRREYADPSSGVRPVELVEVARELLPDPFWLRPEYPFRRLGAEDLPAGYGDGFAVEVPFIHSGVYLERLLERFAAGGGEVELRSLASLEELAPGADLIVNASGLGARELTPDPAVYPIRGQLAIVGPVGPLRYLVDDDSHPDPVYVFPRDGVAILGGTAEAGDSNADEDLETREKILARTLALEPALAVSRFLKSVVGFRPGRAAVRLELETPASGPPIVHNYGHGGAGFTTAWGCADEVAALAAFTLFP